MEQLSLIPAYVNASAMEELVIKTLRERGAMTPDETAEACGYPVTSIRPRVTGLLSRGALEWTGERRPTPAGVATGRKITSGVVRLT